VAGSNAKSFIETVTAGEVAPPVVPDGVAGVEVVPLLHPTSARARARVATEARIVDLRMARTFRSTAV